MTSRAVGTRARLGTGPGALSVDALMAPEDAERAEADANRWIKSLRHARVDGATFRDRFTHRGDSLWWFAEIYLHKRRIIVRALRALYALRKAASEGAFATWDLRRSAIRGRCGSGSLAISAKCSIRSTP